MELRLLAAQYRSLKAIENLHKVLEEDEEGREGEQATFASGMALSLVHVFLIWLTAAVDRSRTGWGVED